MKNRIKRIYESDLTMKPVDVEKVSNISHMPYVVDREIIQDVIDRMLEYGVTYIDELNELNSKFTVKSRRYPR